MKVKHASRHDLLTSFLGQRSYSGRFSSMRVRHVLPLATGFIRWTGCQLRTFAGSRAELAGPPSRKKDAQVTWDVLFALRRLPALPAVGRLALFPQTRGDPLGGGVQLPWWTRFLDKTGAGCKPVRLECTRLQ